MTDRTRPLPGDTLAVYDSERFSREETKCVEALLSRLTYLMRVGPAPTNIRRKRDAMAIEAHALRWALRLLGVSFHGKARGAEVSA